MVRRTALYRLFNADGQLLYVGIAYDPKSRWYSHVNTSPWWPNVARKEVEWFEHRNAAVTAEMIAVRTEKPIHNVVWADDPKPHPKAPTRKRPAMSEEMKAKLAHAAHVYRQAPIDLKAAILTAYDGGKSVVEITRAIEHAYTADYVARIVREHRKAKEERTSS